jgi:hypothetical protein
VQQWCLETLNPAPDGITSGRSCSTASSLGTLWAQTYQKGRAALLSEHYGLRSLAEGLTWGGFLLCHVPDEQVGKLVSAILLRTNWLEAALEQARLKNAVEHIERRRRDISERLRRLGKVSIDTLCADEEYKCETWILERELESWACLRRMPQWEREAGAGAAGVLGGGHSPGATARFRRASHEAGRALRSWRHDEGAPPAHL